MYFTSSGLSCDVGTTNEGTTPPLGGPPSLLAADTKYVYWAAGGTVFYKGRSAPNDAPSTLTMQTKGHLTGLVVDPEFVFMSFFRDMDALQFMKKRSSF